MKKIYSCIILFSLLTGCSADDNQVGADNEISDNPTGPILARNANELPFNNHNGYDAAGALYHEILESYGSINPTPVGEAAILATVERIADSSSTFNAFKGNDYGYLTEGVILSITADPVQSISDIIDGTDMSTAAKTSLAQFLDGLSIICKSDKDHDSIYNHIVEYEAEVLNEPLFDSSEKAIILTTASIARYAVYNRKRKPKKNTDPDWDWMILSIAAGTEGIAVYSPGNAVTLAATITALQD